MKRPAPKSTPAKTILGSSTNGSPRNATPKANGAPVSHAASSAEILGRSFKKRPAPSPWAVPSKWRWHLRVLTELQARLQGECGELRRAGAEALEPHSLDPADSATDEFDHDLALSRLSSEQNALYEVNEALRRIAEGTYGRCEETGQPITSARLKAVPWARFSREVEERLEKKGVVSRAHLTQASTVRSHGQIRLASEEEPEEELEENPPSSPKSTRSRAQDE